MSKVIEDAAQDFAAINEDKACNSAYSYSKYDIADAYQQGADFGYGLAQNDVKKKYEEKNRWIPITEKLPPLNEYVLFEYSEGEYCVGCLNDYGYYCSPYMPAEEDFASIHLLSEVTHWRSFL